VTDFFLMAKICLKTPAHVLKTHVHRMSYGGGGGLTVKEFIFSFEHSKYSREIASAGKWEELNVCVISGSLIPNHKN
jgi:hypothetical protein